VGSSAGRMVARKARQSCLSETVQGSGSQLESACGVCSGSPQNRRVTWLSYKTKTEDSASGDEIRVHREASMLVTRDRFAGFPLGGCGLQQRRGRAMKRSAT
jgi:hypothetical protein